MLFRSRRRINRLTNDGLRDLDSTDQTVVAKTRGREGQVVVGRRSVQGVDIRREGQSAGEAQHQETGKDKKDEPNEEAPF